MTDSKPEAAGLPQAGRSKIRGAIKQFMDAMVDGLTLPVADGVKRYDLIVVGGRSAGLARAMEAARAGLDTLMIEREDFDETGGAVQCFSCCPDVLRILRDRKPVDTAATKTKCFNLEILLGMEVTSIRAEGYLKVIGTDEGKEYRAKAILLSPEARHSRLKVPGEEDFIGTGIH